MAKLDDNVPGIQRPARADSQESVSEALRNIYDNLYYLRRKVESAPLSVPVQIRNIVQQTQLAPQPTPAPDAGSSTIVGTHDQRLTVYAPANQVVGTMFFETDTSLLYIVSNATGVNQWVLIAGGGGGSGVSIVSNEIPSGAIDGTNQTFVLSQTPASNTLELFYKGVLQEPGVDYTLVGNTITFTMPPLSGGYLRASYVVSSGTLNFAGEVPAGAVNDVNTTYTLAHTPTASSLRFYIKGVLQEPGVDYTLAGSTITTALPPLTGSYLRAYYQY